MNGNKLCSIKGCNHKGVFAYIMNDREYRLCHKHKILLLTSIIKWVKIE